MWQMSHSTWKLKRDYCLCRKNNTILAKTITLLCVKCLNWTEKLKYYPFIAWFCSSSTFPCFSLLFWLLINVGCTSLVSWIGYSVDFQQWWAIPWQQVHRFTFYGCLTVAVIHVITSSKVSLTLCEYHYQALFSRLEFL